MAKYGNPLSAKDWKDEEFMNTVGDSPEGTISDPEMPFLAAGMFLANMIITLLQNKQNDFAQARSFVTMIANVHNDSREEVGGITDRAFVQILGLAGVNATDTVS